MSYSISTVEASNVSEIRYRRLFETAQDGILILDGITGSITDVNPFLLNLLGYSHDEFIGKKLWELGLVPDIGENKLAFEALQENEYIQYNDLPMRTKDGRAIEVEFVSNVYMVGTEKTIQCNIRDITPRRHAEVRLREKEALLEEHIRQAQKMESLGTLAAGVAHEFNNLLAMILPAAEMIAVSPDMKEKTAVYVARIIEAANRGADIVKQLAIFARAERSELKPVSLQRIVLDIGSLLSHTIRKDIAVRTGITAPSSMVLGEIGMLHQAVLNLAVNAVDAMPEGGILTLELANAGREEMSPLVDRIGEEAAHQRFVILRVRDTGIGMDETMRNQIFDPFFTTKEHGAGTGLGLSIVHGIVKSHNGFLEIDSTPKAGTTVSVYLPLLEEPDFGAAHTPIVSPSLKGETILILDDEEAIRDTLYELLTMQGYTVLAAADGLEGVAMLREHLDAIDLVITDLGMPRMNGEQFIVEAKKIKPAVKIMITTGYVHTATRSKLLSLGIADLIPKPFSIDSLVPAVRRALDLR